MKVEGNILSRPSYTTYCQQSRRGSAKGLQENLLSSCPSVLLTYSSVDTQWHFPVQSWDLTDGGWGLCFTWGSCSPDQTLLPWPPREEWGQSLQQWKISRLPKELTGSQRPAHWIASSCKFSILSKSLLLMEKLPSQTHWAGFIYSLMYFSKEKDRCILQV